MIRPGYFFEQTSSGSGTGLSVLKQIPTESVTVITRSKAVFCPALSTVCIDIAGTATVNIISNPFDDAAKDFVLHTLTASNQLILDGAATIIVDVSAITGTVSARVVFNQELDC